jgi:predicted metal-dependent hydrolase
MNHNLPVHVIKSRAQKRLSISFSRAKNAGVIRTPNGVAKRHLNTFLEQHSQWLMDQAMQHKIIRKVFEPESSLSLFSGDLFLAHVESNRKSYDYDLCKKTLTIYGKRERFDTHVRQWLYSHVNDTVNTLCNRFSKTLNVVIASIQIKDVKSKWGSCSSKGDIVFNWRLVLGPLYILEYVCAHEVSHRLHMNHSVHFHKCLASLYPNPKRAEKWLKEHHKTLYQHG